MGSVPQQLPGTAQGSAQAQVTGGPGTLTSPHSRSPRCSALRAPTKPRGGHQTSSAHPLRWASSSTLSTGGPHCGVPALGRTLSSKRNHSNVETKLNPQKSHLCLGNIEPEAQKPGPRSASGTGEPPTLKGFPAYSVLPHVPWLCPTVHSRVPLRRRPSKPQTQQRAANTPPPNQASPARHQHQLSRT